MLLYINIIEIKNKNEPNYVQNKKYKDIVFDLIFGEK